MIKIYESVYDIFDEVEVSGGDIYYLTDAQKKGLYSLLRAIKLHKVSRDEDDMCRFLSQKGVRDYEIDDVIECYYSVIKNSKLMKACTHDI